MSRNNFALERPRKISITIPGYDGSALLKAQNQRRTEKKMRVERAANAARDQRVATAITKAIVDDATAVAELEQHNKQAQASAGKDVLHDLMLAFELPITAPEQKQGGL